VIFSDELNHASIIDGCRLSRARVNIFRHLDIEHLRELLKRSRGKAKASLVITEGAFSMDGDLAPLKELRALCDDHDCALMVDEAHSLGLFGEQGRGLCAREGVSPDILIGTLGKAFGTAGAFVAGSTELVRLVENRARSYVFSTAPPPSQAAAAMAALDRVIESDDRRSRLFAHATRLRGSLRNIGYQVGDSESPIIPVHVGEPEAVMEFSARLLREGVFVHGIRPPSVPPGSCRLRITPIATHQDLHIDKTINAFRSTADFYGSITK
jgi:7-keto-8-aminopelargonate synthetase-like enzyme